jgi:soluble lytic murein transglycosylase
MPDTANDIRRRMGWPDANVGRPGDNLRMSAFYLNYLAGQLDSPVVRLAAYNAGLGRGRRWEAEFGDLPLVLQIEALPFVETRWYLRRIAVSHGFYHFRYHGADPADGVSRFLEGAIW